MLREIWRRLPVDVEKSLVWFQSIPMNATSDWLESFRATNFSSKLCQYTWLVLQTSIPLGPGVVALHSVPPHGLVLPQMEKTESSKSVPCFLGNLHQYTYNIYGKETHLPTFLEILHSQVNTITSKAIISIYQSFIRFQIPAVHLWRMLQ